MLYVDIHMSTHIHTYTEISSDFSLPLAFKISQALKIWVLVDTSWFSQLNKYKWNMIKSFHVEELCHN